MRASQTLLRRRLGPTKQTISSHIQIEVAYINTNHPDFVGGIHAITQFAEQGRSAVTSSSSSSSTSSSAVAAATAAANATAVGGGHAHKDPAHAVNLAMQQTAATAAANASKKAVHQGRDISDVTDSNGFMQSLMARFSLGGANSRANLVSAPAPPQDDHDDDVSVDGDFAPANQYRPTAREKAETRLIKMLITSYFNIVRKTVQDIVPKAIMCLLVNATKTELQTELVRALYKEDLLPVLLRERDDVAERREAAEITLATLKRAMAITNEIRDFSPAPGGAAMTAATTSASAAAAAAFAITSPLREKRGGGVS